MIKKNSIILFSVCAIMLLFIVIVIFFFLPKIGAGDPMRLINNSDNTKQREDFTKIFEYYGNNIKMIIAAFGVVGFLISYQQKKDVTLSMRSWALVTSGIILLSGSLVLSILGQELMLKMIEENVIKLNLPSLIYSRWASYGCLILAAMLIGIFFIEIATINKVQKIDFLEP